MSSQVLAIKYRPKRFEDLIGQDSISQTLSLALDSNRLSHAYLFSGLRGSGKTSTARIFSKSLNCIQGPTSEPCETCENCKMANEGRHIDIIEMDAASSRKIDDIRELIEQTKYKPSTGRFKIFIIDEVHMLTKEAFNALLKTLEEPPPYVKFILATTDPLKLPPTILSRTQHFRFKKISKKDVLHHLEYVLNKEGVTYDHESIDIIARSGSGSLRDTLTLLDQAIIFSKGTLDAGSVADMLGLVDPEFLSNIFDAILNKNEANIKAYLKELENYEAEMVIDEMIAYLKERMDEGDIRFSTILIDRFFRVLSDSKGLLALNSDSIFVMTLALYKMMEAMKVKEIDAMIEDLEEQLLGNTPKPAPVVKSETIEPVNKPMPKVDLNEHKFDTLKQKIFDRNYDLGKCFDENIAFVGYENNTLSWKSKAEDECKKQLTQAYGIIKQFVYETYGISTQIKMTTWEDSDEAPASVSTSPSKEDDTDTPPDTPVPPAPSDVSSTETQEPDTAVPPPAIEESPNSPMASSREETPPPSDSCITNQSVPEESRPKELTPQEILEQPMVKKAKELFNPKKIIVESKI